MSSTLKFQFVVIVVTSVFAYSVVFLLEWSSNSSNNLHQDPMFASSGQPQLSEQAYGHSTSSDDEDITICFLVSVYGKWAAHVDRLQNVEKLIHNSSFFGSTSMNVTTNGSTLNRSNMDSATVNNYLKNVHFLAFTNLPRLKAVGWTRIVRPYPQYHRYVTQSRHPKFLGWNDTAVTSRNCKVIFYQDAIGHIVGTYQDFLQMAHQILKSPQGHAQYLHRGGNGAYGEFRRIEVFQKDTLEHIAKSKAWLEAQPDFRPYDCPLYENRYIGYAVNSSSFQKASLFFWKRYSLELDSFRDQPLWCYTLDHFNITPIPLQHKILWTLRPNRMGKSGHKYHQDDVMATNTVTSTSNTTSV